jgi:FKBP-type peptidyl-prolyl cis-trans isomerase FklB
MNRLLICLAAVLVASIGLAQDKTQLKDQKDKASYSIGHDIGTTFKKQNVELNLDALFAGVKDAVAGKEPVLSKEERDATLQAFQKELIEKQAAASKEATGPMPKETDTVVTNYKGTLLDGTEFDSSYKRNEPASFPVNRVIKGWTEALQLMKTGSKYQLFIPSNLAYAERGAGRDIGPNSTLIFEVELISIKPPEPVVSPTVPPPGTAIKPSVAPVPSAAPKSTAAVSPTPKPKAK